MIGLTVNAILSTTTVECMQDDHKSVKVKVTFYPGCMISISIFSCSETMCVCIDKRGIATEISSSTTWSGLLCLCTCESGGRDHVCGCHRAHGDGGGCQNDCASASFPPPSPYPAALYLPLIGGRGPQSHTLSYFTM